MKASASAYSMPMLNDCTKAHINWSAICPYINQVFEYIVSVEVHVPFGDCLPLKKVLVVSFPEGMRRRGTGTGGVVV